MPGSGNVAEPGLGRGGARQRRDHDGAGLGLPPRVDDRAAVAADVRAVPDPGLGVDRLARPSRAAAATTGRASSGSSVPHFMNVRMAVGRGVEHRDLVLLDDRPPPVAAGRVGRALVHHRRDAVGERSVDDVAVAGDPADVGGAPVDVGLGVEVEDVLVGERDLGEVAAGRVHDALGLAGGARRVEQVEQVLAVHRLGRALRRRPSAMSSWYQWSRPSVMGISASSPDAPVRCTTTTPVIDGVSASATSTVGLSSAAWPRRQPPSAVMSTLPRRR